MCASIHTIVLGPTDLGVVLGTFPAQSVYQYFCVFGDNIYNLTLIMFLVLLHTASLLFSYLTFVFLTQASFPLINVLMLLILSFLPWPRNHT